MTMEVIARGDASCNLAISKSNYTQITLKCMYLPINQIIHLEKLEDSHH